MSEHSSPRATRLPTPRWLDARLVLGILLVLTSVVVGARVVAEADDSVPVWAAARDLAPGANLATGDLVARRLRLDEGAARYVAASGAAPTGFVLARPVGAGELLPAGALIEPGQAAERRLVTVPVERFHYPADLRAGERVDVYRTKPPEGGKGAAPALVVRAANVAGVDDGGGRLATGGAGVGVVLSVAPDTVTRVVAAVQEGEIDLVRVPAGQP